MYSESDLSAPPSVWDFLKRSGPEDGLYAARGDVNTGPKLTSGPDWTVRRARVEGTFYKVEAEMERLAAITMDKLSHEGFAFHSLKSSRNLCAKEDFRHEVRLPDSAPPWPGAPARKAPPAPPPCRFGAPLLPHLTLTSAPSSPPHRPARRRRSARPTTRSTSRSSARPPLWRSSSAA